MFTEGLDESAISWIKQGTNVDQKPRSPLAEKINLDSVPEPGSFNSKSYLLSPHVLPPLKFYSGLVGPRSSVHASSDDDDESVASAPGDIDANYYDTFDEEGLGSSDSDLFEKSSVQDYSEEHFGVKPSRNFGQESDNGYNCKSRSTMIRGSSKENLRIEVPANTRGLDADFEVREEQIKFLSARSRMADGTTPGKMPDLGTPSAPPIMEIGCDESKSEVDSKQWTEAANVAQACLFSKEEQASGEVHVPIEKDCYGRTEILPDHGKQVQKSHEPCPRSACGEAEVYLPSWQANSVEQSICYNTSSQNAWQTLIAYDACFRLCLNAWARGCMEAPEFLHDECLVLRNAFGLQKFLLLPKGQIPREGKLTDGVEQTCVVKAKKVVGKIRVEVRKIRIIPRRKLRTAYSQRGSMYMQVGAEYIRHVSALLKTSVNSLKMTSLAVTSEETLSCMFQLKSSSEETELEAGSAICLQAGSGDSHVFFPESQGDALLVEVQDTNRIAQGRAVIPVASLTDNPSDRVRWWPIYHNDQECVGKIQLSISSTSTSSEINSIKSGPVVETFAYDLVLEAAMRAQHFHQRNLRLYGIWKWLLIEFADYYGVTDAYTKLRYLSYIINVATPTKDCLELVHELLIPVVKARSEKILTRQERNILLDCETQIDNLLANVFVNYKSLDELSPSGLADVFVPASDSAAPALVPAVQVYTLLHDILAQEAQTTLKNYLQTAATKRCRRHMIDTDEFMSSTSEGFFTDPLTTATAYLKMKTLCANISNEIQADIKIHNQHILPSSIDLPNIAATVYSTELCNRLKRFLIASPPSSPLPHVTELLIATADFERDLQSWNISPVYGGVNSRNLFHHYIMVWIQDKQLYLLDLCKADKAPWSGVTTHLSTAPFAEDMYDKIKDTLSEYEVVINRWPEYSLTLENAIADVERAIIKAMEKQYSEILTPLKDSIPKKFGMQVQKLTRRQSSSLYHVPSQLGTFLNTIKRIIDVLHVRVEDALKSWASCLPVIGDRKSVFGEQLNGITIMLRTKYKNYMQATVEKLVNNTQANRSTKLKRILEETKEADGEAEIRERMQLLTSQIKDSICNLHDVFTSRIFVAVCRGFWDRMGQIVLSFLESRKENRIWYKGSYYALGVLDDTFASHMQRLQGNALQEKDLELPRSVTEARSILCRDTPNTEDPSTYFYY